MGKELEPVSRDSSFVRTVLKEKRVGMAEGKCGVKGEVL